MLTGVLHPYQDPIVDAALARGRFLIAADMGTGKQQPATEPVLTPTGWRTMGELHRGDLVIGSDGKAKLVLSVHPQVERSVYRVEMNDGSYTLAGPQHLWSVQHNNDMRTGRWRVMSTEEILDHGLFSGVNLAWRVPVVVPVEYAPVRLRVDPYVLGAWLGDGSSNCGGFTSADQEIVDEIISAGYEVKNHGTLDRPYAWYIVGLMQDLRKLGVLNNKHVPEEYMRASIEDRMSVLQGLLDTDGYADPRQGGIEFCTTSPSLRDAVIDLVQGLGGIARLGKTKITGFKDAYRINVKLPAWCRPFRLPRKLANWKAPTKYPPARRIRSIERVEDQDSVCIRVAAEDQLYVTRNHIVTHNTIMSIAVAEELLGCGDVDLVLIVCPGQLRYQWAKSLAKFTDLPTHQVKISGQKVTVPLAPYCVVVDGKPFQKNSVKYTAADDRRRQFDSVTSQTQYVILSYESVLDDARWVKRLKPQLVILDECTQIKSFRAQRAKKIKKMLSTEYRIGLTGTPMENGKPEELFSIMQWVDEDVLGRWDLFDKTYIERSDAGFAEGYKNLNVLRERLAPAMGVLSRNEPGVREYLPEETMDEWLVPLDGPVRHAYMEMGRRLYDELKNVSKFRGGGFNVADYYGGQADESTKVGRIMAVHVAMEQLLDHPDLVIASGMKYEATKGSPLTFGSKYAYEVWQSGLLDDVLESVKLNHLQTCLEPLLAGGAKVLVFTRFRPMLELIEERLSVPAVLYHGDMTTKQKESSVTKFSAPGGPPVFLSSHSGAYGVDLPRADHLVNFDNSWMSGRADQINSRHVRASSQHERVYIHNMVTEGTIEERIMSMQEVKRKVERSVMHSGNRRGAVTLDTESLTGFLEATLDGID
jgi:superfamily II DNA or RNA helicase